MPETGDTDVARLLAELHVARTLRRPSLPLDEEMEAKDIEAAEPQASRPPPARISVAELWTWARREPGSPTPIAMARALRDDPDAARRYRALLASSAIAHAPMAIAASSDDVTTRRIGPVTVQIDASATDAPPLVIITGFGARAPAIIEAACGDDVLRLALPPPSGAAVILSADPRMAEMAQLLRLLGDARSEIFLL